MRRSRTFGLFLGAVVLASTGCQHSWLRPKDEDELPPRGKGLRGPGSDDSVIGSNSGDTTTSTSFFKNDRPVGGLSREAQSVEHDLGASGGWD
jgi:hypothetical protein